MPKIRKTDIDNLKPADKDVFLWDDELKGFGVRCQPAGAKTYVIRYRTQTGVQRKQKLGRTSDFPPEKARDLARKIFAQVAEGLDPLQARRDLKASPTVADLEARYTKEWAQPFKKPSSQQIDEQNWRLHILPALGDKQVRDLTKPDVMKLVGSLSHRPATGNQVLALLSKSLNLAEDWGLRDSNTNPCHRVKRYKVAKRQLILAPDQIGVLVSTMDAMVAGKRLLPDFSAFIKLLLLTGCRKNEIREAEREWLDRFVGTLNLPDSKTGARNITLADSAWMILDAADREGKFLVGGNKPLTNVYRVWARIKTEAGLPAKLRLHDLRHTAGSLGHNLGGLSQLQVASMLGHKQLATTERYLHSLAGDSAKIAKTVSDLMTASWAAVEARDGKIEA